MTEYIDRDTVIKQVCKACNIDFSNEPCEPSDCHIRDFLLGIPTADVAPVRHGQWFLLDDCANEGVYCSECYKKVYRKEYANQKVKSKFCPNCGAEMNLEDYKNDKR